MFPLLQLRLENNDQLMTLGQAQKSFEKTKVQHASRKDGSLDVNSRDGFFSPRVFQTKARTRATRTRTTTTTTTTRTTSVCETLPPTLPGRHRLEAPALSGSPPRSHRVLLEALGLHRHESAAPAWDPGGRLGGSGGGVVGRCLFVHSFVFFLSGCWLGWLIGWLVCWLVGWLFVCLFACLLCWKGQAKVQLG